MYAFRVPRVSAGKSTRVTAALIGVAGVLALAPGAHATMGEIGTGQVYYGTQVPFGDRHALTSATIENGFNCSWGRCNDLECVWAQNAPSSSTPYPDAAHVKYSEDYWRTYGVAPPSYTGDYAGSETCVQNSSGSHPYNGSDIRRGVNFKSGLPTSGVYTFGGWEYW